MSSVLSFAGVRAYYDDALILDGLDFEVEEGESFALLGPNGVGKTTSLNTMFGIAHLRDGAITIGGRPLRGRRPHEAAALGAALVPQGRWILSSLTVEENLVVGSAPRRKGPWDLAAVYAMFPDLAERRGSLGTHLSGGQQQMLAIGRALMSNPRVLLLDEPSEGLAPVVIDLLGDCLAGLKAAGTSMLLIEQRLDLVTRLADRYAVLLKGETVAEGRIEETTTETLRELVGV
ncbi:ABC transporter ATP-binding protein [Nocardioides nitrophenolicus]|uniref:ABC transporter ATP-binding protein n=1 Tax=Nocardioides nitrophenolicus TaxID=60489 RepID=UPI001956D24D|nr:ABC transporter ATP-binding protein [Nocardioides nitrophenolicus]MBM7517959.1 branched-chain amino acid transport system ATP-binding protein [Nocardioides nitrophenolicus]